MKDIIIDGIDRTGKSTLIDGIQHELGFFQEAHYQRPKVLDAYVKSAPGGDPIVWALKRYQEESFCQLFRDLSTHPGRHIKDRSHLGEFVYAPRYRGYDGSYVFDLEDQFIFDHGSKFYETTLLILLMTSDFSFIKDDGLSFDFSKKEAEQEDFIKAFKRSRIKNKLIIDVSNGNGSYRPSSEILSAVLSAWAHECDR